MNPVSQPPAGAVALAERFRTVRNASVALAATLHPEDQVVQTMPDVSPTKWHLAHTTWFFEEFVLRPRVADYRSHHPQFGFLFNSYYHTVGEMHARPRRGLLSRPTVAEVGAFRASIDEAVERVLERDGDDDELAALVELGLHHEQQHQELILTDIKHVLGGNPLEPALRETPAPPTDPAPELRWHRRPGGVFEIGHAGDGFAFDNETPRHETLVRPHSLASRPVTCGEFAEFVRGGGYETSELWLADGWTAVNEHGWRRPLYWNEALDTHYTLGGPRPLDRGAPVCHVSFYEADAYARWAGARLPTEAELELAAASRPIEGNFVESGYLQPVVAVGATGDDGPGQLLGDVWEWTQSPYAPYPGFTPLGGSLGEYNGKFMCNQMTLRGGSCATPRSHVRATYRNFFYPHQRWQFSGFRLARDA